MTTSAGGGRGEGRATAFLFYATLFVATFEKVRWEVAGTVRLADVTSALFVVAFTWGRLRRGDARFPRTVAVLLAFLAAFLLVYLAGFFEPRHASAAAQFAKGVITWAIHFGLLVAGVAYLARAGERAYWRALTWFFAEIHLQRRLTVLQLVDAQRGDATS